MTKALTILLLAGAGLFAQAPTDAFEKAPPGVEDALRARVTAFYQTWMDGKFRAGEKYVSEDAQEFYDQMQKQKFKGCEILRLKYDRDFNDATVTLACKGKWNIQGKDMDSTLAHTDFWTLEKDAWVWTNKPLKNVDSPFGTMTFGNIPNSDAMFNPQTGLPKDFKEVGVAILKQVSVDKQDVQLSSYEKATAFVTVKNGINGYIDVRVDPDGVPPGFSAKFDKTKIPAYGEAKLTLSYDPKDKAAKATASVRITVEQTSQMFPIRVTFAVPPELEKLIEKSKTGK